MCNIKVRLDLDLTQREVDLLSVLAIKRGWLRENERSRWTKEDTKGAIRFGVIQLIENYISTREDKNE